MHYFVGKAFKGRNASLVDGKATIEKDFSFTIFWFGLSENSEPLAILFVCCGV